MYPTIVFMLIRKFVANIYYKNYRIIYLPLTIMWMYLALPSSGIGQERYTYQMVQYTFTSSTSYPNPASDVILTCTFTHTSGVSIVVEGFWNGGNTFCVRFAPPLPGTWQYFTLTSDTNNTGLHHQKGTFDVKQYVGNNSLYAKGFLKVAPNARHLTSGNGEPFFWLGDTAWEIVWKSRLEQAKQYIADRKKKKFSVIQIVPMTHQFFYEGTGPVNRYGQPYFLEKNYGKPNPRYFDYLDSLVQVINDSGMVAAIVPLWAYYNELHPTQYNFQSLNREQSLIIARYIGARYAGSHCVWIVGGDNRYTTLQQKVFWTEFARTLKKAEGNQHLVTVHPAGFTASFDFFDHTTDWLDFHMYQSSHVAEGNYTWQAAAKGYTLSPRKPIVNGEAVYEDIYDRLWEPGDTSSVQSNRIRPQDVRQASYESILSGALIGVTYGANGIWQWNTAEQPGTHHPRVIVDSSWNFPGSSQMTVLKDWLIKLQWHQLQPQPERVLAHRSLTDFIPLAGTGDSLLVGYMPVGTSSVSLNLGGLRQCKGLVARWINPVNGSIEKFDTIKCAVSYTFLTPTSTSDWLVSIHADSIYLTNTVPGGGASLFNILSVYPQPSEGQLKILCSIPDFGTLNFMVFDVLGRLIRTSTITCSVGVQEINFTLHESAIYFYKCEFISRSRSRSQSQTITGKFINYER